MERRVVIAVFLIPVACGYPEGPRSRLDADTREEPTRNELTTQRNTEADTGWWEPFADAACPSAPPGSLELDLVGIDELYLSLGEGNVDTSTGIIAFNLLGMTYDRGCDPPPIDLDSEGLPGDAKVRCSWASGSLSLSALPGTHHASPTRRPSCYVWWKVDSGPFAVLSPGGDEDYSWCFATLEPDRIAGSFTFYDDWYDQWVHITFSAHNGDMAWWQDRSERPCLHYDYAVPRGMAWSGAW